MTPPYSNARVYQYYGCKRYNVGDQLSGCLCAKDPGKAELAGLWRTAIGLKKKVDNMNKVALILPWYGLREFIIIMK